MKNIFYLLIIIVGVLLIFDQRRKVYCFSSDKCITVWKRLGGNCYVIPGRYYSLLRPRDNYLKTKNKGDLDIIWGNDRKLYFDSKFKSEVINQDSSMIHFINYQSDKIYNDSIFTEVVDGYRRYKRQTQYIGINIENSYKY